VTAVERLIDIAAPVERVWRSLAEPDEFARWCAVDEAEFEARAGSPMRLRRAQHGTFHGIMEEASEPHRLCYRLSAAPDAEPTPTTSTLVELTLSPAQVGSRLLVRESGFAALDPTLGTAIGLIAESGAAWTAALERLARGLEGESSD
jgi:uncharacterized protein YndB with AHSA1/START domain